MKYIFTRTYVGQDNRSFYRGTEVPADFPEDVLKRFVESGLVHTVETPNEFVGKINKKGSKDTVEVVNAVEELDPDKKARSK